MAQLFDNENGFHVDENIILDNQYYRHCVPSRIDPELANFLPGTNKKLGLCIAAARHKRNGSQFFSFCSAPHGLRGAVSDQTIEARCARSSNLLFAQDGTSATNVGLHRCLDEKCLFLGTQSNHTCW
ncbi:hypothetical protein [Cypionkella sp. TWP1-2-1b2]|uniref:hypothetical protein n=1 Tax=Cypionkella sp. TWP1-2-1b2 TaxID=2804675 RepID=UPI003CE8EA7E